MKKFIVLSLIISLISIALLSGCGGGGSGNSSNNNPPNPPAPPDFTSGLAGYYPFDGDVNDHSGTGDATKNGTVQGNTTGAPDRFGVVGRAITFPDSTSYILVTHHQFISAKHQVTLSLWFKSTDKSYRDYFISNSDFGLFYQGGNPSSGLSFAINNTSGTNSAAASFNNAAGDWIHFVGTYDGKDIKAYINGVLQGTTHHTGSVANSNFDLTIGSNMGPPYNALNCTIDDLRIYERALSARDVAALYNYHN